MANPAGVAAAAAWSAAGDLALARLSHEATLLPDGRVLVTGGNTAVGNTYDTKAAEIYEPGTNSWSSAGMTSFGRAGHTATRLADGKVLVAGGVDANICTFSNTTAASAELYDPSTGTWTTTGSMATGRYEATATLLPNGMVLVAGGGDRCGTVFSSAELYDPATGTWSPTGSMTSPREFHDAVPLADGRVLAVGGDGPSPFPALTSAEIYDPFTGTWTASGAMTTARAIGRFLTPLADGRVLATGGVSGSVFPTVPGQVPSGPSVEIFDPATGSWSATGSLSTGRTHGSLSLLSNGMVLAAGGTADGLTAHSSAELWDPATGSWSPTASMAAARTSHTATVLSSGQVLAASGYSAPTYLSSAELYTFDDQGPLTSDVVATPNPVAVNASTTLTATVDDSTTGGSTIDSAEYSLDGGATWTLMSAVDGGLDEVSEDVTATFNAPATSSIYDLCVRGTDSAGNVGLSTCIQLVVYDPSGGFVTGGGWIDSPIGAYARDPFLSGKASFGFVSKYHKGATVPSGTTQFVFQAAGLDFESASYQWLVVNQGGTNAQFKGTGTINDAGSYDFMVWAGEATGSDPATFRIKITDGSGATVYDNGVTQPIGGGSIIVHKGK